MRRMVFLLTACLMLNAVSGCAPKPHSESRFIMDTLVRIEAYGSGAPGAISAALDEMARIEALMSSHIPTSDVSRLNAAAGKHPVEVSDETAFVLTEALRISRLSDGAFDVTVGPLVEAWGITGERQRVPSSGEVERAVQLVDYRRLSLEGNVAFLEIPGMRVDLGAIAKGYAVDRAVRVLADNGISSALLDAGGNVFVLGNRPDGGPWRVGIRHPRRTEDALAVLEAKDLTIVTSGDYQRYFVQDGKRYHHIFDTSSGYPARGVMSATVVSRSSVEADALSTAVFIMGPTDGLALIELLEGVEALVMDQDGEVFMTPGLQPVKLDH